MKVSDPISDLFAIVSINAVMYRPVYKDAVAMGCFAINSMPYGFNLSYGFSGATGVPGEGLWVYSSSYEYVGEITVTIEYERISEYE